MSPDSTEKGQKLHQSGIWTNKIERCFCQKKVKKVKKA